MMFSPGSASTSPRVSRHDQDVVSERADTDDGCVRIRAERIGSRTVIIESFRSVPFHLGIPSDREGPGRAEVIIQNVGPGALPGDRLLTDLDVGPTATLEVRGQGANRIYPSPLGIPAEIDNRLRVAMGGLLVFLPGELIPYRTARLRQTTVIDVAKGGHLAMVETLTRGREAMGERSLYTSLDLRIRATYDDRLCLVERSRLEPGLCALDAVGRHGPFAVSASLYLIGERWRLPVEPHGTGPVVWATDAGGGHMLGRVLGPTMQTVNAVVRRLLIDASAGLEREKT